MKLPRDLSGEELAKLLRKYGYEVTRQTSLSHVFRYVLGGFTYDFYRSCNSICLISLTKSS